MKLITPQQAFDLAKTRNFEMLRTSKVSEHFSWEEVFKNRTDAEIRSCGLEIFKNALKQAETMEKVRAFFGNVAIWVQSWFRPEEVNRRVGGANNSQHLKALATDFQVQGYEGLSGNSRAQKLLDSQPFMQDKGLETTHGTWTHVDTRGYKARF